MKKSPRRILITPSVLRRLAVPLPGEDDDKEARGRVLVVGGSAEMPGACVLAATAALRAGAGKVRIATVRSAASAVAAGVLEARVYAMTETRAGGIAASSAGKLAELAHEADAVCVGPGMIDAKQTARLLKTFLPKIKRAALVLDADALLCLSGAHTLLHSLRGNAVITPNADEMKEIAGVVEKASKANGEENNHSSLARRMAAEFRAVVALKSRETFIAAPEGDAVVYSNRAGNVGLATSGSGDVLAGVIAGLLARGASPLAAAAWGVHTHALAGGLLARRVGTLGFLARELLDEIPRVLARLSKVEKS